MNYGAIQIYYLLIIITYHIACSTTGK